MDFTVVHEQYFHDEEQVTPNPDLDDIGIAATKKYDNLIQATKTPLYHDSLKTKLGALLEVMSLKERKGMNNSTFTEVVDLCKRTLPEPNTYPELYAAAKRALKDVDMGYEVFDACVNSCHLYYKEGDIFDQSPVCGTLRYTKSDGKKIPRKQVRYFPLMPRLQRLYMSQQTACEMRWHGQREKDPNDDVLRHPTDDEAWKDFDKSVVVSAGLLRVFGREVAELPLVATSRQHQGKGYFQALFICIEELRLSLGVKLLVLPAAEEAESIWTKKLGFRKMSDQQVRTGATYVNVDVLNNEKDTGSKMLMVEGISLPRELTESIVVHIPIERQIELMEEVVGPSKCLGILMVFLNVS